MGNAAVKEDALGYTETLDAVVVALCRDQKRRERAIEGDSCSKRVAMEYKYINNLVREGAAEIVGEHYADVYIGEIGSRIGWVYSKIPLSESAYKLEKAEVKLNIARKLHLLS